MRLSGGRKGWMSGGKDMGREGDDRRGRSQR